MKEDGVWRTVGGRRIFIKDGQSLSDAMRDSGKFSHDIEIEHIVKELESLPELNKKLEDASMRTYDKMSPEEQATIGYYTYHGDRRINEHLNGELYDKSKTEEYDRYVNNINNAMNKFEFNEEYTSYFGTSSEYYGNYKKGDIIDINRFKSSSTEFGKAEMFATEHDSQAMIIKIKAKPNSKKLYIGVASSEFITERETLFSNKQKFKVIDITEQKGNVYSNSTYKVLEVETYE